MIGMLRLAARSFTHPPLAGNRLRENGIGFKQLANAFLKCAAPDRLQALANSLIPRDLVTCGQKWLAHLTPFFTR